MTKLLTLFLSSFLLLGMVFPVKALAVDLELTAQGRSLESAGGWGSSVPAKPGDTFLLWFVVKNTSSGTVANNAKVKVDIPTGESNPLVLTVHATADNASEVTQLITVNLTGPSSTIEYVPGKDAEVITNGVHTAISPDTAGVNMTTQYVNIGNINGGDFSYAKVVATTKIASRTEIKPTVTVVPTGTTSASSSAVVKTTPDTGANEVVWMTLAFMGMGFSGYSIRKWANKISV